MRLWITRDSDGELILHKDRPIYNNYCSVKSWCSNEYVSLPFDLFPEITFGNSPQEVELKLVYQTEIIKIADCNPKAQPCVLTNHGIDTNVVKFD